MLTNNWSAGKDELNKLKIEPVSVACSFLQIEAEEAYLQAQHRQLEDSLEKFLKGTAGDSSGLASSSNLSGYNKPLSYRY